MWDVSKISSRTLFIWIHLWHKRVYFLRLILFCTLLQCSIYFFQNVRTSFWLVHIPEQLFLFLWFRKICNIVTLWSASETHIWISTFVFITFILAWIKRWTEIFINFSFYFLLKNIFSLMISSTISEFLLSKFFSLSGSYLSTQIQVINLQGR